MSLTVGTRLRSRVCETEIMVVRPPATDLVLHCGGAPMATFDEEMTPTDVPTPHWDGGSRLGKRYTSVRDDSLEVLVTREGKGTLGDGEGPLSVRESKPLPSSD
jgi:hypothetical protein